MKQIKRFMLTAAVLLLGACSFWAWKNSRAAVDLPKYEVLKSDGDFELRSYDDLPTVTVRLMSTQESFMRLFRYITGQNSTGESIAMTTPVIIQRGTDAEDGRMSFFLPPLSRPTSAPQPSAKEVKLAEFPAGRVACLRFRGKDEPATESAASEKLLLWVTQNQMKPSGTPFFAYYDPPWTPTALRKNEVMVRIAP